MQLNQKLQQLHVGVVIEGVQRDLFAGIVEGHGIRIPLSGGSQPFDQHRQQLLVQAVDGFLLCFQPDLELGGGSRVQFGQWAPFEPIFVSDQGFDVGLGRRLQQGGYPGHVSLCSRPVDAHRLPVGLDELRATVGENVPQLGQAPAQAGSGVCGFRPDPLAQRGSRVRLRLQCQQCQQRAGLP